MTSTPKKYCTPMEAAAILMVSPVTVREWARKGVLPSVSTAGGHRRFLLEELKAFAATHGIHIGEEPAQAPADALRVLLVDDNEIFATYLREIIVQANPAVRVEWASDGFEAGQLTEALRPQFITVDLHMPRVDGIELCRRLRANPTTAKARIVVLSGALTEDRIAAARAAGADECLGKDASRTEILRTLGLPAASAGVEPGANGARA